MTYITAAVLLMLAGDAGADAGADATAAQDAAPADATAADARDDARGDAAADGATGDVQPAPPLPPPLVTVPLRGRVLEKGTRRPLAGVSIIVDGAAAAETDQDGALRAARPARRAQPADPACPVTTIADRSASRSAPARPKPRCCSGWRRG